MAPSYFAPWQSSAAASTRPIAVRDICCAESKRDDLGDGEGSEPAPKARSRSARTMLGLRVHGPRSGALKALSLALALMGVLSGCATTHAAVPATATEEVGAARYDDGTARSASNRRPTRTGYASWYGRAHQGKLTASGEVYDMRKLTAAHRTLPLGTRVRVTNLQNGRTVFVRVNDRGPMVDGRIVDLSYAAARELHAVDDGVVPVRLDVVSRPTR